MKKYLFLYAVLITALLAYGYTRYRHETRRLTQNQNALASGIEHYRTRLGQEAASVQALRLRCAEFERLRAGDADTIRRLGIRLGGWKPSPKQSPPRASTCARPSATPSSCSAGTRSESATP